MRHNNSQGPFSWLTICYRSAVLLTTCCTFLKKKLGQSLNHSAIQWCETYFYRLLKQFCSATSFQMIVVTLKPKSKSKIYLKILDFIMKSCFDQMLRIRLTDFVKIQIMAGKPRITNLVVVIKRNFVASYQMKSNSYNLLFSNSNLWSRY